MGSATFLAALASRFFFGACLTRFTDVFLLRICGPFIIATHLVLASFTAAELLLGIVTGLFCLRADTNVLEYADYEYLGQIQARLAHFYITGVGGNPLQEQLTIAVNELASINS